MTFHVRMLRRANSDLNTIVDYIYKRSRRGAAAWVAAFEDAKSKLEENADDCPEADENHRFEIELKQSLFKTQHGRVYRLVFTVERNEVRILRIRGSGQAPIETSDI